MIKSEKNLIVGLDIGTSFIKAIVGIINEDNDIEKIAKECGTISREILTSISQRVTRQYL